MDFKTFSVFCLLICSAGAKFIKTCPGRPADIVFILDESRSIWYRYFEKQLEFVRDVASEFTINPAKVRIGVITWSTETIEQWDLEQYTDKDTLLKKITTIKQANGGETNTHNALVAAREMFQRQRRPNVPAIAILMTDGISRQPKLTVAEAFRLQHDNVTVFAIGISDKANVNELHAIASDPDEGEKGHYFKADNFDKLNEELKNRLVASTCEIKEVITGKCDAQIEVDLAFVIGSINQNPQGAKEAMGFIYNIVDDENMYIGPHSIQVALVPIDHIPIGFYLNTYKDKADTLFHFNVARDAFETTADMVDFMRDRTFTAANGARDGVRKVSVIILDRKSLDTDATVRAAEASKAKGIEIIAIGVGDQIDDFELSRIASNPGLKFTVNDYNELWNLRKDILYMEICP